MPRRPRHATAATTADREVMRPNPGPQTAFLSTLADIAIFGGSAGCGKTRGLLMEAMRHYDLPDYRATLFRRTLKQIEKQGSLWDSSEEIYPRTGASSNLNRKTWTWPSGAQVQMAGLEYEKSVENYLGAQIDMMGFDELVSFCVTPDTDVLTETGWKRIADVTVGERVASLSKYRWIEYQPVTQTHSFPFSGRLVSVTQRRGVSFRVTPNHRCVVDRQDGNGSWGFVSAEHLSRTVQTVPRSGKFLGRDFATVEIARPSGRGVGPNANAADSVDAGDYLELLGWYLSEGSCDHGRPRTGPAVKISQRKFVPALDALFHRLPWKSGKTKRGDYYLCSRQLYDHFIQFGLAHDKRVPRWVFSCSRRLLGRFWDAFMAGDGHRLADTKNGRKGWSVGLCNEGLIDDLQEIAFLLGLTATKGYQLVGRKGLVARQGSHDDRFDVWILTASERNGTMVKPRDVRREPYCGQVHCLTVAGSGTFLMRHNGRYCWTGNSKKQFFYLFSRNRGRSGVPPYVRATTNPDADSWVAEFISWWINPDTGYPIARRSGKIRHLAVVNDKTFWGDTREELVRDHGPRTLTKTVTFIPARLEDNPPLLANNPGYEASLNMLSSVDRLRLKEGNWKVRAEAGKVFSRFWFKEAQLPTGGIDCRFWDLAGTKPQQDKDDPDYSAGAVCRKVGNAYFFYGCVAVQEAPAEVEGLMERTARQDALRARRDGAQYRLRFEIEPGSASVREAVRLYAKFAGLDVRGITPREQANEKAGKWDKVARASAFAAQARAGNVYVCKDQWLQGDGCIDSDQFLSELHGFPDRPHDDVPDAASGCFNSLPNFMVGGTETDNPFTVGPSMTPGNWGQW